MNSITKLPAMQVFNDITVVPCKPAGSKGNKSFGPIWPNWNNQVIARHCRSNIPIDKCPEMPSGDCVPVHEPLIWGGVLHRHFGHFVAEIAPRILQSRRDCPSGKFLYAVDSRIMRSKSWEGVPGHFKPITEWFGLQQENVLFCRSVIKAKHLEVAVQAEQLGRKVPCAEYLDLLDENRIRNKLVPQQNKYVFVSRARMPARLGGNAAPDYFDTKLKELGVKIFYPEKHSLVDQLAIYSGAEKLIFAQGSAVHGLQLLGRGLMSVSILNRSPETGMAKFNLTPRCENLNYIDASRNYFNLDGRNGIPIPRDGKAIFETDVLFEEFKKLGLNLSTVWNQKEYLAAVEENLKLWLSDSLRELARRGYRGKQTRAIEELYRSGFEDASNFGKDLIKQYCD